MKTVLHIVWTLNMGGIERQVLDLCIAQKKSGWNPLVLVGRPAGTMRGQYEEQNIGIIDGNLKSGFDLGYKEKRRVLFEIQSADIVHIHTFNPTLSRWAAASDAKIIFTYHGNFGFGRKKTWRDRLKSFQFRHFINRNVDYLTFNSEFTRSAAERIDRIRHQAGAIIYNGVDIDAINKFDQQPFQSPIFELHDHFIIGATARLAQVKRLDRLIEAFADMTNREQAKLLLLGDGPLRAELETQVDRLGIRGNVIFAGHQDQVRPFQKAMDVCVVPSRKEAFGLVAVEALALGKPTVVFEDGGGLTEIVAGLDKHDIVENIEALTQRLEALYKAWGTGDLADEAQIKVRQDRANDFTIKVMNARFLDVYNALLSNVLG